MAFRIVWLKRARTDFSGILDYISTENPRAARSYGKGIRETAARLQEFPNLGQRFNQRYRALLYRNHFIFYTVDDAERKIRISRVVDARRDIETALRSPDESDAPGLDH